MLARSYVGYGASTLGADAGSTNPQPRQQLGENDRGTSFLQQAYPMPGAMMNHFVIANWYDPEVPAIFANDDVKIMKYYSGAEISGTVKTADDGMGLPNARILIERDAFSGEGSETDEDTYWIPIGMTDADENGDWSFLRLLVKSEFLLSLGSVMIRLQFKTSKAVNLRTDLAMS